MAVKKEQLYLVKLGVDETVCIRTSLSLSELKSKFLKDGFTDIKRDTEGKSFSEQSIRHTLVGKITLTNEDSITSKDKIHTIVGE